MPYLPKDRQYRTFDTSNLVFNITSQNKNDDDDNDDKKEEKSYRVAGYFTTFNEEYELFRGYYEQIAPTALDNTDMSDVIFQLNHEGTPLARQRNHSLTISVDEKGGYCEADLSGCEKGRETYEAIKNGLIVEMSFGFTIADDGFEITEDDEGNWHSTITNIAKIYDVSCVSIPANPGTEISARSYLDGAIEAIKNQQEMLNRAESERAARRVRAAVALELIELQ